MIFVGPSKTRIPATVFKIDNNIKMNKDWALKSLFKPI
jgi:hypothetical protein